MQPLTGREVATRVQGLLHEKYQVHAYTVDLTVRRIHQVDPVGIVDYGGNEYHAAGKLPLVSLPRRPDDKYEWWDLGRGSYFVEYNESFDLAKDEIALLEPCERLLRAGGSHVPVFLRGRFELVETLLHVDVVRLQIKQNARISQLRVFRFGPAAAAAAPRRARQTKRPKRAKRRKR